MGNQTKPLAPAMRVRRQIKSAANGRPRLSVFRSSKQIYVQVIDDAKGVTIAAASSLEKELRGDPQDRRHNVDPPAAVGKVIAERAKQAGVTKVVFDRGGYMYHGRVKALAEAAREAGLNF
jgi:large subunit ribosomal protein L18